MNARTQNFLFVGFGLAVALVAGGCPGPADLSPSKLSKSAGSGTGTATGPGAGAGGAVQTGLPCDVAAILAQNCLSCHSNPPIANAPMPLVTYDDLAAMSPNGGTYADRALVRMQDNALPMPPAPAPLVSATDIATFAAWVNAGLPMGDCNSGGAGGAGPNPNPYDTPEVCTSMQYWSLGDEGSSQMHPGVACINCHNNSPDTFEPPPQFDIAGTVYPTAHEPDDCFGASGGLTVEITDAANNVISLPVNGAGNFLLYAGQANVAFPIHAIVKDGSGAVRAMSQTVTTGDCNSCHTQGGSGTPAPPGRIMAP